MKSLGSFLFIRAGLRYDYPFVESITSLCENTDKVSVVGIESEDNTIVELEKLKERHPNLLLTILSDEDWNSVQGSVKLSYFQNIAASKLDTDYLYYHQADECTVDESWKYIREAMEEDGEAYMATRLNFWKSPSLILNVPQHRKPCSTEVCRLAKNGILTYSDGESFGPQYCYTDYSDKIVIAHYGFIRKKEVHVEKIRQMQRDIFLTTPDAKLEGMENFDGSKWFGNDDLIEFAGTHSKIMQEWIRYRP